MKCRTLTDIEFAEAREFLYNTRNKKYNDIAPTDSVFNNYYLNPRIYDYAIYGCYIDNKLSACAYIRYSLYEKEYTVDYVMRSQNTSIDAIITLLEYVLSCSEDSGYYRFFIRYLGDAEKGWNRLILSKIKSMSRYISFTDIIIPAGRKSSLGKYWIQFQRASIFKDDLKIKSYSLYDEFRIF